MPELMRAIASRLRAFVSDRRSAHRQGSRVAVSVALLDARQKVCNPHRYPPLAGHTRDISATGLALIVPAIRISDRYLTGEDRTLRLTLELPGGAIEIDATPVRYERLDEDDTERGYLIGALFKNIGADARASLQEYLKR